jgi:hypothetical protein
MPNAACECNSQQRIIENSLKSRYRCPFGKIGSKLLLSGPCSGDRKACGPQIDEKPMIEISQPAAIWGREPLNADAGPC